MDTHNPEPNEQLVDRLLPTGDALGQTGVSRSKLYELLATGEFPFPVKIGRNNYFSQNEVQRWIAVRLAARHEASSR